MGRNALAPAPLLPQIGDVSNSERLLLASIHDVSPRFEAEVERLLELLHPYLGNRLAMLVVPNHWGDAKIVPGSPFATRLRRWADEGIEMFLHGFFHRDDSVHKGTTQRIRARLMTANEGEFLGLSRDEASTRIEAGRSLIEQVTGRPIDGFVAPAWLYGAGALKALQDQSIQIAEDHLRVWSPATGRQLARGPVITWASRTRMRLASSLVTASLLRRTRLQVLRIGVHPPDGNHPRLIRSIEKTFRTATTTHRAARYADLLAS